tara:strand:- start:573 stop:755 length:183 start_codon:yes stop_codon:yes gene_type:complete
MDDLLKWPRENVNRMKGAGLGTRLALAFASLAYIVLMLMGLFIVAPLIIVLGWLYAKIIG